jgi:hypothetical protein
MMQIIANSADQFVDLMGWIWEHAPTDVYNELADARIAAKRCGLRKMWAQRTDGYPGYVYQAADGSRVNVWNNGNAVRPVRRHST